jgi:hypothetical protein
MAYRQQFHTGRLGVYYIAESRERAMTMEDNVNIYNNNLEF